MPTEWETWGRDSAIAREKLQLKGSLLYVIWVKSCRWRDLKSTNPNAFRRPYKATDTQQEMICTIPPSPPSPPQPSPPYNVHSSGRFGKAPRFQLATPVSDYDITALCVLL